MALQCRALFVLTVSRGWPGRGAGNVANSCIIKPMPGKLVSKKKVFGGLLVAGCILTQLAVATPQVANVSGSANHGSKVTVSGSGFGAKSTAARPVVWDPCSSAGLS